MLLLLLTHYSARQRKTVTPHGTSMRHQMLAAGTIVGSGVGRGKSGWTDARLRLQAMLLTEQLVVLPSALLPAMLSAEVEWRILLRTHSMPGPACSLLRRVVAPRRGRPRRARPPWRLQQRGHRTGGTSVPMAFERWRAARVPGELGHE